MRPLSHYLRHSLILHAGVLLLAGVAGMIGARSETRQMKFVILPKGTSLDAVLTKEVEAAMKNPARESIASAPSPTTPKPSPIATPAASPSPTAAEPARPSPSPSPTPIKIATPTPAPTPAPSAVPQKTISVAPKGTPEPTATPKAAKATATATAAQKSPTPKPTSSARIDSKRVLKPLALASPTPNQKKTAEKKAKPTPKKKDPTPTPLVVASAYDVKPSDESRFSDAKLPQQTPSNVRTADALPGQEVGVPGVSEGVEGAPLPLDKNQSMLSMLYTTRAKMRIQSNFTAPPGVDDPNMVCVIEWEILPDGTIQNARVAKSTGVAQYDSCAIDALNKTQNLGSLPPEFGKRSVWTSLTFVYAGEQAVAPTN